MAAEAYDIWKLTPGRQGDTITLSPTNLPRSSSWGFKSHMKLSFWLASLDTHLEDGGSGTNVSSNQVCNLNTDLPSAAFLQRQSAGSGPPARGGRGEHKVLFSNTEQPHC